MYAMTARPACCFRKRGRAGGREGEREREIARYTEREREGGREGWRESERGRVIEREALPCETRFRRVLWPFGPFTISVHPP